MWVATSSTESSEEEEEKKKKKKKKDKKHREADEDVPTSSHEKISKLKALPKLRESVADIGDQVCAGSCACVCWASGGCACAESYFRINKISILRLES